MWPSMKYEILYNNHTNWQATDMKILMRNTTGLLPSFYYCKQQLYWCTSDVLCFTCLLTGALPACVFSVAELRQKVSQEHAGVKRKELEQGPKASYGYGGKFGVEKDRMDKVRLPHSTKYFHCFHKRLVPLPFLRTARASCLLWRSLCHYPGGNGE